MYTNNKKGFTLVELIVVITILSILGTIAFISFQWYGVWARNSVKIQDMRNIETGLELFKLERGIFPEPTNAFDVTYQGWDAWTQGTFGDQTRTNVKRIPKTPLDPATQTEYTYSVTENRSEFELGGIGEPSVFSQNTSSPLFSSVYANTKPAIAITIWNYNGKVLSVRWQASDNSGNITDYILAVPSIITRDSSTTDFDILYQENLVFNKKANLPASYEGTGFNVEGWFSYIPDNIVLFEGSLETLGTDRNARITLAANLKSAYENTTLINETNYEEIKKIDTTEKESEANNLVTWIIVNNSGGIEIPNTTEAELQALFENNGNGNWNTGSGNQGNDWDNGNAGENTQWRDEDSNCDKDDILYNGITWAGCNSTLGGGTYYNDGTTVVDATTVDANGNIYGKLYNNSEKAGACPSGWRIPNITDFESLIPWVLEYNGSNQPVQWSPRAGWDIQLQLPLSGIYLWWGYQGLGSYITYHLDNDYATYSGTPLGNYWYMYVQGVVVGVTESDALGVRCVQWTAWPSNGVCGTSHGQDIAYPEDINACSDGSVANWVDNWVGWSITWNCEGVNGGSDVSCSANHIAACITQSEADELNVITGRYDSLKRLCTDTAINFYSDNLTEIPSAVFKMTHLESLTLENNNITSIPPEIWNLTKLETLLLRSNNISSLPDEIGNLIKLESLSLENNNIISLPSTMWQLTRLKDLSAHSNQLTTLPNEIGDLANLEFFSFDSNQLETLPLSMENLENLISITLSNNSQLGALSAQINHLDWNTEICDTVGPSGEEICIQWNGTTIDITVTP